jgi:2-C-methyl-D-erythritol 4-phosphate cytidylyltransferase
MAAVLAAGGLGERLNRGNGLAKQFILLAGKPIYLWSLERLCAHPKISKVVVVSLKHMLGQVEDDIQKHCAAFMHKILVTEGGASRQNSVRLGLEILEIQDSPPEHVLIHDAARPFFASGAIDEILKTLQSCKGCTLAVPVSDTVKRGFDNVIVETIERTELFFVQTPQAAEFRLLLKAHRQAQEEKWQVTDDIGLLEKIGIPVKMVLGSSRNFKITNEDDLYLAEALVSRTLAAGA